MFALQQRSQRLGLLEKKHLEAGLPELTSYEKTPERTTNYTGNVSIIAAVRKFSQVFLVKRLLMIIKATVQFLVGPETHVSFAQ